MSDCKHEFLEIENNDLFLQCTKCGAWIEINEYPLHEAEQRIKDLEAQLAEAREAIKEHKKRKKSWGFEGSDYDKVLWEQLKEK